MAKSASPIRLQEDLMKAAKLTADRFHRSTAEQIEFWAELGRSVDDTLDLDVVISVKLGLSRIKVEPVYGIPVDPNEIFSALEVSRKNGTLSGRVTSAAIRFQTSSKYPGYLKRINQQGNITTGRFQNGLFVPLNESAT